MPILDAGDRLQRLYDLRARISQEIQQIEADNRRRQRSRDDAIRAAAPAKAVRAWATAAGIAVPANGRLPIALRQQYIDAHTTRSSK